MNYRVLLLVFFLFLFSSCSKAPRDSLPTYIQFQEKKVTIFISEQLQLKISTSLPEEEYSQLNWISHNPGVVSVSKTGEIKGLNFGTAKITVKFKDYSDECIVEVLDENINIEDPFGPLSLNSLQFPLSEELVFSKNVALVAPFRVPQSFDLDSKGNIYYSQIGRASGFEQGKTKAHELYIIKSKPNVHGSVNYMTLKYFGHGSQMAIEEDGDDIYVWIGSNGTKYSSGEYWDSRSISRIKFEAGRTYEGYGGENFFLNNGLLRTYAAINKKSNLICINATDNGTRYFYTYKLSDAMAAPLIDFSFLVTIGGEEVGTNQQTVERTLKGRDLSRLTPLGWFSIPPGENKVVDPNSYSFQGYDIDKNGFIYFFEGNGYNIDNTGSSSKAYVTVYDKLGKIVRDRTEVKAIESVEQLMNKGLTNSSGYMEAEGIKIKGDKIYLQFASYMESDNKRRANIIEYSSHR